MDFIIQTPICGEVCLYIFFQELDIDFELIDNLSFDKLRDIELIIVPGGFASQKIKRLRDRGLNIIRDFVKSGGSYIGICGGAGLAFLMENSILGSVLWVGRI